MSFRRFRRRCAAAFIVVGLSSGGLSQVRSAHAAGDVQDIANARAISKRALVAYQDKNYQEAIDLFEEAEQLHHAVTHLLYLARSHLELNRPVEAFELYNQIIREKLDEGAPAAFVQAQAAAREEVDAAESKIAYVVIEVEGPGADGAKLFVGEREVSSALAGAPAPVNPGPQTFHAEAEGARSDDVEKTMKSGKETTVKLTLMRIASASLDEQPDTHPKRSRIPAYVALGVGAAGVAVGTGFTVHRFSQMRKADELFKERGCDVSCTSGDRTDVEQLDNRAATAGTIAWVGYGVGAAGLGAGIALLLISPSSDEGIEDARGVRPYFGWGEAGLVGRF